MEHEALELKTSPDVRNFPDPALFRGLAEDVAAAWVRYLYAEPAGAGAIGRCASSTFKDLFRTPYSAPFGGRPRCRSFSWRLPDEHVVRDLIGEAQDLGVNHGVSVVTCRENLLRTS